MASADDDCSDYSDGECCRAFQAYVELEQAKSLPEAEKREGKGTAVRKAIKDGLKESGLVTSCEASIMPKYQDKKTKKIKDVDFVTKVLPELALMKCKGKKQSDEECKKELKKMRKKLCRSVKARKEESKGGTKADKVTDRLTDTSKYTGAHKERFDDSGKGKGIKGREERADNSGYVGNYKGAGTYDKK